MTRANNERLLMIMLEVDKLIYLLGELQSNVEDEKQLMYTIKFSNSIHCKSKEYFINMKKK